MRFVVTEKALVRRHDPIAPFPNGMLDGSGRRSVEPNVIGQVWRSQRLIAFALGSVAHDIRASGVAFETAPDTRGPTTARCLILVTPDAQRTMATYLGACIGLGPDDVDGASVAAAQVTYLEGYLWDLAPAKEAKLFHKPTTVSFEHAAVATISGITALQALTTVGRLEAGQHVLVIGAAGAVGSYALQNV